MKVRTFLIGLIDWGVSIVLLIFTLLLVTATIISVWPNMGEELRRVIAIFQKGLLIAGMLYGVFRVVAMLFFEDDAQRILRKALAARNRILGGDGAKEAQQQLNDIAVSVTYLKRVKYRHAQLMTLLLVTGVAFATLIYVFELWAIADLGWAPALLMVLIVLKEGVLEFRIKNGLFGSNAYEARPMINFLLENAVDIDFTDGSGKPKRALLPGKFSDRTAGVIPAQEAKA